MAELTSEQLADRNQVADQLRQAITNFFGLTNNGEVSATGIISFGNKGDRLL